MNNRDGRSFEDELMTRAANLPEAVTPDRDLWPEIEHVISAPLTPKRSGWNSVWAQAAAAVLLIGGSSGLTYMTMVDNSDRTGTVPVESVSDRFGSQNLGLDFVAARSNVADDLDEKINSLPAETREEVLTNLEAIRSAISDINQALADQPDSVLLQEMLLEAYRDELGLMQKVSDVSRDAMRRGDI